MHNVLRIFSRTNKWFTVHQLAQKLCGKFGFRNPNHFFEDKALLNLKAAAAT